MDAPVGDGDGQPPASPDRGRGAAQPAHSPPGFGLRSSAGTGPVLGSDGSWTVRLPAMEGSAQLPARGPLGVAAERGELPALASHTIRISTASGSRPDDDWRSVSPTASASRSVDEGVPAYGSESEHTRDDGSDAGSMEQSFFTSDRLIGEGSLPPSGPGSGRSSFSESVGVTQVQPGGQPKRGRLRSIRHRIRRSVGGVGTSLATALGADYENLEEVIQRGTLGEVGAQRKAAEILKHTAEHNPHRLMKGMDQLPWVETLIDFASSDDVRSQLLVSQTVLTLAEHEENRLNLVEAGLLQPLMYLRTNCSDSTTKTLATEALDKLGVYSHQSLLQLVRIQGMGPLRYLGGCGDVRAQRTAASVLSSLLDDDEARLDIVRGDGFRTVLCLATSSDEYIQTIVSMAIANLPVGNMDLVRIVDEGSLQGVVALMDSPRPEFRSFATQIVCNVIALESFQCADCSLYPVGSWHSSERFCIASDSSTRNIDLCKQCARLRGEAALAQMQEITVDTQLRERVVAEGGHTALINVIKLGIVPMESQASLETDTASATALQSIAVRALASLTLKSSHAASINTAGGTAVLVELLIHFQYLSDGALTVLRNATRALANLACCARHGTWQGEAIARSILSARALQPLLVLTLHQDVEVVRHTARTLAELASVRTTHEEHHGSTPSTREYADDEQDDTPTSASVISVGSASTASHSAYSYHGTPSALSPHRTYRSLSNSMIRTQSSGKMQPQIILECDGVEWLCFLSSHEDWVVKGSAALIFERISAAAHAWLAHRAAGVVPAVMSLAEEANPVTRQHAKYALAALSKYEVFQSRIITQGEMRAVIRGRPEDGVPEKRLTSVILRHLSASDACRHVLLEEDPSGFSFVEEVLQLLALDDSEITMNLAYVISDMSHDEQNLEHLSRQEAIATVIAWGVSEDETLQMNAAVTLENLAAYQPAKALLGSLGAVPVLINHLALSQNVETARRAVEAMGHLSKSGPLDMPMSPNDPQTSESSEAATIIKVFFHKHCSLVELRGVDDIINAQYDAMLEAILEQCELPSKPGGYSSAEMTLSYVDSQQHVMKVNGQRELHKVVKYHASQTQGEASDTFTLILSLRDDSMTGIAVPAPEQATKEDFDAFRKPIDSFVEIDESQLEFRDRIGVGACGEVFHGKWRGVDVAVKCLFTDGGAHSKQADGRVDKELLKDFRNEVRLMMQLRHPNICLFMGAVFKLETQRLCIVSEFCHRGSLYRILHKSERALPLLRRVSLALDAAKGCHFLHTHKPCIVHRDLKSPNLLVDKHWNLKVGDFGLARTKAHFYVSLGGGNVGTPEWTAPEVLKDDPFNEKADVYSFGVVLWEICTRQRPFRGLTQMQVVVAVGFNGERLPRVSHWDNGAQALDAGLDDLMVRCMADEWQTRPSFETIVEELTAIVGRYQKRERASQAKKGKSKGSASSSSAPPSAASAPVTPPDAQPKGPGVETEPPKSGGRRDGRLRGSGNRDDSARSSFEKLRSSFSSKSKEKPKEKTPASVAEGVPPAVANLRASLGRLPAQQEAAGDAAAPATDGLAAEVGDSV